MTVQREFVSFSQDAGTHGSTFYVPFISLNIDLSVSCTFGKVDKQRYY